MLLAVIVLALVTTLLIAVVLEVKAGTKEKDVFIGEFGVDTTKHNDVILSLQAGLKAHNRT